MNAIKRCLALALTLVMVLSLIPAQAIADSLSKTAKKSDTSLLSTALHTSLRDTAQALSLVPADASIQRPSGIADDTRVSYEILATGMISTADTRSAALRFTLEHPVEQPVTFHYTAISGSANTVQHLTGTCSGTVSFAAGEMQQDVEIEIAPFADNPSNYGTANSPNAFWTGTRLFYLYCDNINNALFTGDRNSITIPVPVESEFNYATTYSNAASAVLVDLNNVPNAESPGVYLVPTDGALTLTAEISGDVRKMLDAGVFTHIRMPTGYFLNETDAAGIVSYQVSRSRQTDGLGSNTTLTYDLSVGSGEKTFFFSDVYPQTAAVSQVGLGKNAESNGIFKRLDFIFDGSNLTAPVKACFLNESGGYLQQQVRFTDDTAPSVNSVTIGMYEAHYGDEIPVIISFSEPIHTDGITFTVDGKTLYPMEATGTISDSVSFLYTVGDAFLDATEVFVNVENIIGAVDLSGKGQESAGNGSASAMLSSVDPERAFFYCAEPTVTLNQGTSRCAAATVSIPIKRDGNLSNWLLDLSRLDDSDISSAVKANVMTAAGIIDIPLTVQTDAVSVTGLTGSFTAPENTTGENEYYALEIYMDTGSGYKLVYGLSAFYAVPPLTLVDDTSDLTLNYSNWPSGNSIFADAGTNLSLHYTINVAATWQGTDYFTWTSSDEAIAAIDASGNIALTGVPGEVSFTLTVTNPLSADTMTFESRTLTVREAEGAYLHVPNGLKNQEILMGGTAKISISSNLCQRNDSYGGSGTETDVTFTLYAADYEGDMLKKGDLLSEETLSATAEAPTTFYTVPAQLQNTTVKGRYGYILEVSAKDMQSGVTLTDTANIRVRALPARAVLTRMESAYLTDSTDTFPVGFDIDNKNAETEYLLTVTKNSQSVPVLTTSTPAEIGRTLTVSIGSVDDSRLMDVYTVSLKAKNGSDEAWSYDSYCVYVYNADAMKILVDGSPYGGTTLMLKANFEDGDIIYNTDVLRSPSSLGLTRTVSLNGSEYDWSSIADKVTWSAEGDSVSVWYGSGGEARRIGADYNPILLPGTALILHGDGAGNSVVTATHTLTGMSASLNVSVSPVDRLYLFQAYPNVSCDLVYTNGRGEIKTVPTGASGQVGVYEESGIAGDVVFYPTHGAEAVYDFAVLSHSTLAANQNTSGRFALYPLNTVKLSKVNYNVSLSLYDEETGAAYTGDVVIRGGVYLNDVYQSATTINGTMGNADQTVSAGGEGQYCLEFSPSDFTDSLTPSDLLKYVIEVRFRDNTHLTQYITVENDEIQAGKASPLGVCLSERIKKLDASSVQNRAVVLSQTLTINGTEKSMSDLLCLEKTPESATLDMTLMIQSDYGRYYQVLFLDSTNGRVGCAGNAEVTVSYPFSDTVTLHSSVNLYAWLNDVIQNTLKPGEKTKLYPMIRSTDGSLEIKLAKPISIQNFFGIPKMDSILHSGGDGYEICDLLFGINAVNLPFSDDNEAVKSALEKLAGYGLSSASFGIEVKSTSNPLVYKGIIRFAAGSYSADNPSGVFVGSGETSNYNFMPGVSDVKAMSKGTFLKDAKKEMSKSHGRSVYGGGAYLQCEIYFSTKEQKWKVRLLEGDVYLGGGGVYRRSYNGWVSYVPVTATFQTSMTAELGFTILHHGDKTAYIPRLRPVFSIYGFGGVGRDYEVVSLKAGVYGFAQNDQLYLWYSDNAGNSANGQNLTISGEVGVEYAIKLAFIELNGKYVLTDASKSWTYNDYSYIHNKLINGILSDLLGSSGRRADGGMLSLVPVEESVSFENRSYLEDFDRSWGSSLPFMRLFSTAASDTITGFWTNAYPYANPSTSDDGVLMTYLSDMDSTEIADTAACFTVSDESGAFPEGKEISASDYPDSDLSLSGTSDGASAVWVRSFTSTDGKASGEATAADAVEALSAAEVMAGIYGDGTFTTTKLTDNDNPDLAPVTAASGNRAVAAWRSVTLGALDHPLDFTSDYIMYSVYNGSDWSTAKYLYDGSVDDVSVLKAAMLPDGTSAIVYQIAEVDGGDSEIVCAVLNAAGEGVQTLRLTDNATADENPQITTAEFPDGTRRFVVGWNAQTESGESVVHFAALSAEGALYPAFTLELSDSTGTSNYANFHFTKGAEKLEDLSVVWCQPEDTDNDGTYAGVIYGTKFVQASDGTVAPSGKLKLLALDEGRTTENFDVRVDPATGKLHFVLLLSETSGSMTLATADYEYQNTLTVETPYFEYENVLPGLAMPVRFTVTNDGIAPITELNIALGDQTYHYVDESIAPGESKDFLVSYPVPDPITDPSYTVTAQFGSDGGTDAHTGVLTLALPDVGIYQISLTKETQRERGFRVLLQNNAYVDLQAGTHTVTLEVWDTPDFDSASPLKTITISGDDLTVLNDSLLSVDVTLTAADLADILDEDGEIQDGGALVYFRVLLTEDGETIEDADRSNDMDYISIHSLIERNGAAISLASLSQTADGRTNVQVDAFNNSMNAISNGNLIVTLRDENGNALETKQTYNSADSSSLLSISGEESETASLLFDSAGYTADVTFARVSGESKRLSVLNLTGVPLDFDPDIYAYTVQTHDLSKSSLTAVAENPASTISVTRNGVLVSVSGPIALSSGLNTFVITVLTGDTSVPYTVTIQNIRTDDTTVSEDDNTDSAGLIVNGATRIALSVRMSGGNARLSLGSLAQDIFSGNDEAVLTIPAVAGADSYTLEASAAAFADSFTEAALTVYTEFGSVRIPSGMLAGMTGLDGKTAGITIAAGDKMTLSDDIRTIVGDRPLLSLTLTLDGLQTDWSNPNAPVAVGLPYAPSESELEDPESIVIWYIDGNGNTICIPNGHYDPVSGTVTFTTSHFSDYAVAFNPVSFSDVASSVWYHDAVSFIAARGITTGTGDGQFSPDMTLTRGQFITLLLRTYGIARDDSSADNFSDAGNTYYTGYLAAAKRLGISDGVGENKFAPEQALTRQEMFTLLYNALKVTHQLAEGDSSKTLSDFSDADSISFYAKEAIAYLVKAGIVGGNDGQLLPRTTTTRAQMAQVLYNLLAK